MSAAATISGTGSVTSPPVTFDATTKLASAHLLSTGTNMPVNTTSHTCTGSARGAILVVATRWGTNPTNLAVSATFGGTSMTSAGTPVYMNNVTGATSARLDFFYILNPASGANTVAVFVTANQAVEVNYATVSAAGVGSVGGYTSAFGTETGTTLSLPVTSATNRLIVQAFMHESNVAIGSYNQTKDQDLAFVWGNSQSIVGHAAGAATVTFTATRASGVDYCEAAAQFIPA
jgi:hypothetical protein